MTQAIHISTARRMLDSGQHIALLRVVTTKGAILEAREVVSIGFDFYGGTRTIKYLRSAEKRTIRDACIVGINDFDVYL